MSRPKINARLEHVRRKPERRGKDRRKPPCPCGGFWQMGAFVHAETCERPERFSKSPVFDGNPALVDGPIYNQGRAEGRADVYALLRKILDPTDVQHWNADGVLNEVRRLKVVERESKFQNAIDNVHVELEADSYIKELVKANLDLLDKNYALEVRLMQYDQRRETEKTVKMWLNPDPHLQAENERLRVINAKLHDALLKKEKT